MPETFTPFRALDYIKSDEDLIAFAEAWHEERDGWDDGDVSEGIASALLLSLFFFWLPLLAWIVW